MGGEHKCQTSEAAAAVVLSCAGVGKVRPARPTAQPERLCRGDQVLETRATVVVVVHHLDQARAALAAAAELGCALALRSAPGAAGYAGVGYLKALSDQVGYELLIDCGDDAGLVMAALRTGCRRIAFSGGAEQGHRLGDMAEQLGATLVVEAQAPEVMMLQPEDDAAAILRACVSGSNWRRNR